MELTHLSLFSGIGGLDLAAEWAGFKTVGQCEWADYPTKVLEKHWPDVPRWRDIRTLTGKDFYERTGLRTVDVISGGFPCQPFSVAGKQRGKEDDRYLWPEMLRVIRELKPNYVIGENVPGILRIAGRTVCEDLEREGYAVTIFNYEAAAVGAKHRRDRVFFTAHAEHDGQHGSQIAESIDERGDTGQGRTDPAGEFAGCGRGSGRDDNVADPDPQRIQGSEITRSTGGIRKDTKQYSRGCRDGNRWWSIEPDVGRVANGVPSRVDRLKCLGNAVVPQQAYPIFKAIATVMNEQEATPCAL